MSFEKKTHSYWNACHVLRRQKKLSREYNTVHKFSEVTCKFCIKLNKEREQDPVIHMAHNNGMAILPYTELSSNIPHAICFNCGKKHSADKLYVFQTRFQCGPCVRYNFVKPDVIDEMKVHCKRCNTKFLTFTYSDRNWNSTNDFIQCPGCMVQFGFDQEVENDWDSDITILNVQLRSDVEIVNNLEIPIEVLSNNISEMEVVEASAWIHFPDKVDCNIPETTYWDQGVWMKHCLADRLNGYSVCNNKNHDKEILKILNITEVNFFGSKCPLCGKSGTYIDIWR